MERPVVLLVMDGVALNENEHGNAVKLLIRRRWTNFTRHVHLQS